MRVFLQKAFTANNFRRRRTFCLAHANLTMRVGSEKRPWREAASLIIAAPHESTNSKFIPDYSVLYLKRASRSSFFPNAYVYPGGALDDADLDPKWFEVFSKFDGDFKASVIKDFFLKTIDKFHTDLFPSDTSALRKGILPNEIAFRICAIRETFEESGLLLLTNDLESRRKSPNDIHCKSVTYKLANSEAKKWRKKVHENADEFINLCLSLDMVPDIWSLKEWSQWLTPLFPSKQKKQKRFDTVFYSCCLREMPAMVSYDNIEMTESLWKYPADMIQIYLDEKGFLAPPQILENARLLNFSSLERLNMYSCKRARCGIERWTPYIVHTADNQTVELLPGDDMYPDDFNPAGTIEEYPILDKTYEQIESVSSKFRMKYSIVPTITLANLCCTCKIRYEQVAPGDLKSVFNLSSKL